MSDAPRYHHGALAEALVHTAMDHANGGGLEQVSLRGLARELNVSHPAVYRHFTSKAALLRAVADRGFVELDQRLATCVQPDHRERFEALASEVLSLGGEALARVTELTEDIDDVRRLGVTDVGDRVRELRAQRDALGEAFELDEAQRIEAFGRLAARVEALVEAEVALVEALTEVVAS